MESGKSFGGTMELAVFGRMRNETDRRIELARRRFATFAAPGGPWEVKDVSQTGFRLLAPMSVANAVTLGTLAAIRPHGQTPWTLGIVRRMKRMTADRAEIGLQVIANTLVGVDLVEHRKSTDTDYSVNGEATTVNGRAFHGLFLSLKKREIDPAVQSLIVPAAEYQPTRRMKLHTSKAVDPIRFGRLIEQQPDWVWATVEPLDLTGPMPTMLTAGRSPPPPRTSSIDPPEPALRAAPPGGASALGRPGGVSIPPTGAARRSPRGASALGRPGGVSIPRPALRAAPPGGECLGTARRHSTGETMTVDRYAEIHAGHRWTVPAEFNIAHACCGRWAGDRARFALYWEDESGAASAHSFWDLQREANRLSNVLAGMGVGRGDKVALILPQRRETRRRAHRRLPDGRGGRAAVVPVRARRARVPDRELRSGRRDRRSAVDGQSRADPREAATPDARARRRGCARRRPRRLRRPRSRRRRRTSRPSPRAPTIPRSSCTRAAPRDRRRAR